MEKSYKYLPFFFMLILFLAPIGFRNYITRLIEYEKENFMIHFHAIVMTFWCILLIVQPLLILRRKQNLHRWLGRFSYGLTPVLVISMFMMLYHSLRTGNGRDLQDGTIQNLFFPFTQIIIFTVFYAIAMLNIKTPQMHMRYIIVSSISLLGPTIGRINFDFLRLPDLDWDLFVMEFFLVGFVIWDIRKSKNFNPYAFGFLSFAIVHVLIVLKFEESWLWEISGRYLADALLFAFGYS